MSAKNECGPFRPRPGGAPPYLAGRESEQSVFRELLGDLERGIPPQTQVVLYGPRGNGRTALLHWLEDEMRSRSGIEVLRSASGEIRDVADLVELLRPAAWWGRLNPREAAIAGFYWKGWEGPSPSIADVLSVRARTRPLVLVLDQAQTLDLAVGRSLWTASLDVAVKSPFLLVLAGTPDLRRHLNAMEVPDWNRAERVSLGHLAPEATAEAFRRPFDEEGMSVEPEALDMLVEESHGYPYFVQLLGRSVWRCATRGTSPPRAVSCLTVEAALPEFWQLRDAYYLDRYTELKNRELLGVGRRVAEAFKDRSELADSAVEAAIAGGLAEAGHKPVMAARDTLSDLGFIWGPGPTPDWEPGIPSLMDYIRERAPT